MGLESALRGRVSPLPLDRPPPALPDGRSGGQRPHPDRDRPRRRRLPRDLRPCSRPRAFCLASALRRPSPAASLECGGASPTTIGAESGRSPQPCRAPDDRGTAPASSTTCCPGAQDGGSVGGHPGPVDLSPPRPAGDPGPMRRRGRHLPDLAAIVCLVGPMLIEQRDAWAVSHCHPRVRPC